MMASSLNEDTETLGQGLGCNHVLVDICDGSRLTAPLKQSSRIKYTCLAVGKKYVALGANTGAVYLFDRQEHHHFQVIDSQQPRTEVTKVAFSPDENCLCVVSSSAVVSVIEHNTECSKKSDVVRVSSLHKGGHVTSVVGSEKGARFFLGDNNGKVTAVSTSREFFKLPSEVVMKLDSPIVQLDVHEDLILVSTATRCYLGNTNKQQFGQVGKKLREVPLGGCFFQPRHLAVPMVYCARPGSRLWEVDSTGNVLNTHQFKQSLDVPALQPIDIQKQEHNFQTHRPGAQSVAFTTLGILGGQYLLSICEKGLFILQPSKVRLLQWADNIKSTDILDHGTYKSELYVLYPGNKVCHLTLMSVPRLVKTLFERENFKLCGRVALTFSETLLEEKTSKKYNINAIMGMTLRAHLKGQGHLELAERLDELIDQLDKTGLEDWMKEVSLNSNTDQEKSHDQVGGTFNRTDSGIFVMRNRSTSFDSSGSFSDADMGDLLERLQSVTTDVQSNASTEDSGKNWKLKDKAQSTFFGIKNKLKQKLLKKESDSSEKSDTSEIESTTGEKTKNSVTEIKIDEKGEYLKEEMTSDEKSETSDKESATTEKSQTDMANPQLAVNEPNSKEKVTPSDQYVVYFNKNNNSVTRGEKLTGNSLQPDDSEMIGNDSSVLQSAELKALQESTPYIEGQIHQQNSDLSFERESEKSSEALETTHQSGSVIVSSEETGLPPAAPEAHYKKTSDPKPHTGKKKRTSVVSFDEESGKGGGNQAANSRKELAKPRKKSSVRRKGSVNEEVKSPHSTFEVGSKQKSTAELQKEEKDKLDLETELGTQSTGNEVPVLIKPDVSSEIITGLDLSSKEGEIHSSIAKDFNSGEVNSEVSLQDELLEFQCTMNIESGQSEKTDPNLKTCENTEKTKGNHSNIVNCDIPEKIELIPSDSKSEKVIDTAEIVSIPLPVQITCANGSNDHIVIECNRELGTTEYNEQNNSKNVRVTKTNSEFTQNRDSSSQISHSQSELSSSRRTQCQQQNDHPSIQDNEGEGEITAGLTGVYAKENGSSGATEPQDIQTDMRHLNKAENRQLNTMGPGPLLVDNEGMTTEVGGLYNTAEEQNELTVNPGQNASQLVQDLPPYSDGVNAETNGLLRATDSETIQTDRLGIISEQSHINQSTEPNDLFQDSQVATTLSLGILGTAESPNMLADNQAINAGRSNIDGRTESQDLLPDSQGISAGKMCALNTAQMSGQNDLGDMQQEVIHGQNKGHNDFGGVQKYVIQGQIEGQNDFGEVQQDVSQENAGQNELHVSEVQGLQENSQGLHEGQTDQLTTVDVENGSSRNRGASPNRGSIGRIALESVNTVKDRLSTKARSFVRTLKDTKDWVTAPKEVQPPLDVAPKQQNDFLVEDDSIENVGKTSELTTENETDDSVITVDCSELEEATKIAMEKLNSSDDTEAVLKEWVIHLNQAVFVVKTLLVGNVLQGRCTKCQRLKQEDITSTNTIENAQIMGPTSDKDQYLNTGLADNLKNIDDNEKVNENELHDKEEICNCEFNETESNALVESTNGSNLKEVCFVSDPLDLNEKTLSDVTHLATVCFEQGYYGENISIIKVAKPDQGTKTFKTLQFHEEDEMIVFMKCHLYCLDLRRVHCHMVAMEDHPRRKAVWTALSRCLQVLSYEETEFSGHLVCQNLSEAGAALTSLTRPECILGCILRLCNDNLPIGLEHTNIAIASGHLTPVDLLYICERQTMDNDTLPENFKDMVNSTSGEESLDSGGHYSERRVDENNKSEKPTMDAAANKARDTSNGIYKLLKSATLMQLQAESGEVDRLRTLGQWCQDKEVYVAVTHSFLQQGKPPSAGTLHCTCGRLPRPQSHRLSWLHSDLICDLLRLHTGLDDKKTEMCALHGFWLGVLFIQGLTLETSLTSKRREALTVAMQLGDPEVLLSKQFGVLPLTEPEVSLLLTLKQNQHCDTGQKLKVARNQFGSEENQMHAYSGKELFPKPDPTSFNWMNVDEDEEDCPVFILSDKNTDFVETNKTDIGQSQTPENKSENISQKKSLCLHCRQKVEPFHQDIKDDFMHGLSSGPHQSELGHGQSYASHMPFVQGQGHSLFSSPTALPSNNWLSVFSKDDKYMDNTPHKRIEDKKIDANMNKNSKQEVGITWEMLAEMLIEQFGLRKAFAMLELTDMPVGALPTSFFLTYLIEETTAFQQGKFLQAELARIEGALWENDEQM